MILILIPTYPPINFRTPSDPQNLSSLDDPRSRYIKLKDDNSNILYAYCEWDGPARIVLI